MSKRQGRSCFVLIPPREALAEWGRYDRPIASVLEEFDAGQTIEDVLTCIQTGRMQLWRELSRRAVGVTEVLEFPKYRVLLVYIVVGSGVRDWAGGLQQLERYARARGCKYLEFVGRPGWEKLAALHGFDRKFIRMRKSMQ